MLITLSPRKSNLNHLEVDLFKAISALEGIEEDVSDTLIRINKEIEKITSLGLKTTMRWQATNSDGHHISIVTYAIDPDLGAHIATVLIR